MREMRVAQKDVGLVFAEGEPRPVPQWKVVSEGNPDCSHRGQARRVIAGDGLPPSVEEMTCPSCSYVIHFRDDPTYDWPSFRDRHADWYAKERRRLGLWKPS
jgi:hypothetical protein